MESRRKNEIATSRNRLCSCSNFGLSFRWERSYGPKSEANSESDRGCFTYSTFVIVSWNWP